MKTLPYYGNESMQQKKGFLMIFVNPSPPGTIYPEPG